MASDSANTPAPSSRSDYIDPAAIMRIKNLQLRAKIVVEGFYNGLHRSPFHGFSVEFSEYRQYAPGDDLRHLDWRLWARTDRYFIKQFEDETNRRVYLIVDLSKSMGYAGGLVVKVDYARTLAATLAYYFTLQRDNVGLFSFDDDVIDYLPARFRPGHLRRLMGCLERAPQGKATDLAKPLEQVAALVKKRGLVILISDLLAPTEKLDRSFGFLRARGHEMHVMRVLDRHEIEFPFDNASMFRDFESQRDMYIDAIKERQDYKFRFDQHHRQIDDLCRRLGVDYSTIVTDEPLEFALFNILIAQSKRGRTVRHSRSGVAM